MLGTLALLHHRDPSVRLSFLLLDNQISYYESLGLLGLGSIETIQTDLSVLHWQGIEKKKPDKAEGYKKVQEAHQALSSLKEGNLALFRDLMKGLSKPYE